LPDRFAETSTQCYECHKAEYESASNPDHVATGFPTDCEQCHGFSAWRPSVMPEHDAIFPIFSGTHRNKWEDCSACHTTPGNPRVFSCLTCHEHDQSPMDGVHQGITGYVYASAQCYDCHPTGDKGRFTEHDAQYFPIYSGVHGGTWSACATCHTDPSSRAVFDCLTCHEHDQAPMDGAHQGITGYAYTSTQCYACHPTGQKGRFVEHDAQFFPIYSGVHGGTWSSCATCHTDPSSRAVFDCLTCHEHDQAPMDGAHQGMPGYAYSSTQCYACHPTGQKGRFVEHDAQFFPIYSGVHNGRWSSCATCHTDPSSRAVFTCLTCHEHAQAQMDDKHREVQGYSYTSAACYTCHPDGRHE
jgi:hypothetical protein